MTAAAADRSPPETRRPTPFLQMLTVFLRQDFRFPILETFAFLFVLSGFFFGVFSDYTSETALAFGYVSAATEVTLLIFMVLIWRNVSAGLGAELEKGVMQTYFTYPLSRGRLYAARLLSSVGVPYAVFIACQLLAIAVVAPAFLVRQGPTFWLGYAADFGTPLLVTALVLLVAVLAKQGGLALVAGVFSYFVVWLFLPLLVGLAQLYNNYFAIGVIYVLNPFAPVQAYFNSLSGNCYDCLITQQNYTPTLASAQLFVLTSYLLTAAIFAAGYFWFTREVEA